MNYLWSIWSWHSKPKLVTQVRGQKTLQWHWVYHFVLTDQIFQSSFKAFWSSHIPKSLTWTGQKKALIKSLPTFPIFLWLSWNPQGVKIAPFLSLVCIGSTLKSPNPDSGRPKEATCFTEQLGMDLGCPYRGGDQKVVFVGKHSRITSITASADPFISQTQQCMGGLCPVWKNHEFRASHPKAGFPAIHV